MMLRLLLFLLPGILSAQEFRLAPPQIRCDQVFFTEETQVSMAFSLDGALIRYTLDGSEPNELSALYRKPLRLRADAQVRARAFHPDFLPSETVGVSVFRTGPAPDSVALLQAPDPSYNAGGNTSILVDGKMGSDDLHDGAWLGFLGKPLEIEMHWKQPVAVQAVRVAYLTNTDAWVFPPLTMYVYGKKEDGGNGLLAEMKTQAAEAKLDKGRTFYTLEIPGGDYNFLKVVVNPFGPLPDWHPGKGTPAWLFIDEIATQAWKK